MAEEASAALNRTEMALSYSKLQY